MSTTPTIEVVKQAAKKFAVVNNGEVTELFRTKREAEEEAERQRQDEQHPEMPPTDEQLDEHTRVGDEQAFAALVADKLARIAAAKAERAAVKDWEAAGSEGDKPATPVLDWMNNTSAADKAKATRKPSKGTTPKVTRPAEQEQLILDTIRQGRADGLSYAKIGVLLDEAGVPTARGGKWDFAVVASIAHRHNLAAKN